MDLLFFFAEDHQAFIRSIEVAPHDDAPRLVYADYLEEHELYDAAEYLRLSVKIYRDGENQIDLERLFAVATTLHSGFREKVAAVWDIDINAAELGLRFIAEAFRSLFGGVTRSGLDSVETGKSLCIRRGVTREDAQSVVETFQSMPMISSNIYRIRFTIRPQWQENDWGKTTITRKRLAKSS